MSGNRPKAGGAIPRPRVQHPSSLDGLIEYAASLSNERLAYELRNLPIYGTEQQWAIRFEAAHRLEEAA